MQIDSELYRKIREAIESFPPYPDLDALVANCDLLKVRGGYNVLTECNDQQQRQACRFQAFSRRKK